MRRYIICSLLAFYGFVSINGQDSIRVDNKQVVDKENKTVEWVDNKLDLKTVQKNIAPKEPFKPDPTKAIIYSAIFPGLGQIYNKKYWKLPLVYAGFIGLTYAVTWNAGYYRDYSNAYLAVMSDDPRSPENVAIWKHFLYYGERPEDVTEARLTQLQTSFKRKKDFYRRNRDLSIIGVVALYAICMIDAYVDAQLFDFDVSPDLSLRVEPTIVGGSLASSTKSFGVQCSIKF